MGLFIKSKKEKQEDLELKEYLDKLDKMDEEYEKNQEKINLKDLFKKDPLEDELRKYMTEEQLAEEAKEKRATKMLTISICTILGLVVVACIIIVSILAYMTQDDLHKIYQKEILNYYSDRYGSKTKLSEIKYLCYMDVEKKEVCTDTIYAKTTENKIILKQNENYGDNISISKYYDDYKKYLTSINPDMELFSNNPLISDIDFNPVFHRYIDYINVMPSNGNFNNLLNTNKLTIIDTIMYQGTINQENINNMLAYLNDNSKFIFIKTNKGLPIGLTIMEKNKTIALDITATTNPDIGITNYQLDSSINTVNNLYVLKLAPQSIETLDNDYEFTTAYSINIEKARGNYSRDEEEPPSYFFLMFDGLINGNETYEIKASKETEPFSYEDFYVTSLGNQVYIIGDTNLSIGNKQKKQKGIFN